MLVDDPRHTDAGSRLWLQTSPEFAMKRLLAVGGKKIYQVTRAFRAGERGALHNPEFTIVEWYRVGDTMDQGMDLLSELTCNLLNVSQVDRLSYHDAFREYVSIDPHTASVDEMEHAAMALGISPPSNMSATNRDDWLNLLLAECVEPNLGKQRPLILFHYPESQAALACVREGNPRVAERFELYAQGIELANGYHELTDPDILLARNRRVNAQRRDDGKNSLPEESQLIAAMQHGLPRCTGVALGLDRLVMIASGAKNLKEVMAFPIDNA
jgi:lysyl-tRNA synthetase class 2